MKAGKFSKQISEQWVIFANFALNMDIAGGEDLVVGNCTIVCVDNEGTAAPDILDQTTKSIGAGTDKGKLYIRVKGGEGTVALSPYKFTFKSGDTTSEERWEKDVFMTLKEI